MHENIFSPLCPSCLYQRLKAICVLRVCAHSRNCVQLLDRNPPGSSVHGIFQARILEGIAILSSKGSSWPSDQTWVSWTSCIGKQNLYRSATRESLKQY